MRYLLMLAAAASLAACHQRSEDEVGAAPERDTTAVTRTDTTAVTDTTMGQTPAPTDTSFVGQDTTNMNADTPRVDTTATPTPSGNVPSDTLTQQGADTSAAADTTMAAPSDTSAAPSDTTKY
jgi:hypothetical protein